MVTRSFHTTWLLWWSDDSGRFRVAEVTVDSHTYDRLTKMQLAYDSEQEADRRRDRLNAWLNDDHPLGASVPAGNHIMRPSRYEREEASTV